jgi:hypothetical protein
LFFESDEGKTLRKELVMMTESKQYKTLSMYSTIDIDGQSFVDKHMRYMSQFPAMNRDQYVSNLKLMTKIR